MRIIWLCNTLINEIAEEENVQLLKPESWIKGIYERIKDDKNVRLYYFFPNDKRVSFLRDDVCFSSFIENMDSTVEQGNETYFAEILNDIQPDVIHIFGTECVHSYEMVKACKKLKFLDRVVVSIQGLVSVYAKHYYAYLPIKEVLFPTLRDILKRDSYYHQKIKYVKRGIYEKKVIGEIRNVIGRTDWDEACVRRINPSIRYFFCNETLREPFYGKTKWNIDNCEKHSIFVSQSNYPIKGFHLLLEILPEIIKKYPDTHVYTTGKNPLRKTLYSQIKITSYDRYMSRLINENHLEDRVTFLGYLDENQMHERFIKSNVFISTSSIENSPNSVGEAMILGVPTISSDVGGVKNLLTHGENGFLYQADAPYMIPYYVDKIFADSNLAKQISRKEILKAETIHDVEMNYDMLVSIYLSVVGYDH